MRTRVFYVSFVLTIAFFGDVSAKQFCTDGQLQAEIQSTIDEVNSQTSPSVCQSARNGVKLAKTGLKLLQKCEVDDNVIATRHTLQQMLTEAQQQEAGSCSN